MKTPSEYSRNLKNNVITKEMLLDCLYSSNKRAKNWRDKEREYRRNYRDKYSNEEKAREEKEYYYRQKEILLSVIQPICIHRETIERVTKERIYSYDDCYWECKNQGEFVHEGSYWDRELQDYVEFGDVLVKCDPKYHYYLFYDVGGDHTFHTPIEERNVKNYNLDIIDIKELQTEGHDITELLSTQFVKKVIDLITAKNFKYVE